MPQRAGERILEDLLADAGRRLREEGFAGDIHVFKNNSDPAGHSYVCQENYLVGRRRADAVPVELDCLEFPGADS